MTSSFALRLAEGPALLFDGGLASELEWRGADLSGGLWSARTLLEQPELIRAVHEDYVAAGVDVLSTSTYQLSQLSGQRAGIEPTMVDELLTRAIKLAEAAAQTSASRRVFVAVSFGPYGAAIGAGHEYDGRYGATSHAELRRFHEERLLLALDAGAELFILETFPRRDEILIVAELAANLKLPAVILSLQLRSDERLGSGESLIETIQELSSESIVTGIGINCCGPRVASQAFDHIAPNCLKPVVVQANSGAVDNGKAWTAASRPDDDYLAAARQWLTTGARGLGGCCQIGPATIIKLRALLDEQT